MKPLNTRTALRVKAVYGTEGRVLGGVYHSFPIASPHYLRRAIVYTHLNPYRTRKREDYESYRWSSHSLYAGNALTNATAGLRLLELVTCDLKIFSCDSTGLTAHEQYMLHVDYWRHHRECKTAGIPNELDEPLSRSGDQWYRESYVPAIQELVRVPKEDLRDLTLRILAKRVPAIDLEALRTKSRNKLVAAARKDVAIAAFTAGHSVAAIASFLGLTSGRVSQITSRLNIYSPPHVRLQVRAKRSRGKKTA